MKKSFAKINLGLRVLGKRQDGFHEIESIFQKIDLHDVIEISDASSISMTCDTPNCPTDENNLIIKAAKLIRPDDSCGCEISLKKRIPIGAGLGGGSSNAATALVSLNEFWDVGLSQKELLQYAEKLGSDVPFFINSNTALVTGRGEHIQNFETDISYFGILIYPNIAISSRYVYQNLKLDLTKSLKSRKLSSFIDHFNDIDRWRNVLCNDLKPVVLTEYPQFKSLIDKLYQLGAFYAQMSGSGSCFYGLFNTKEKALFAQNEFSKDLQVILFTPIYNL